MKKRFFGLGVFASVFALMMMGCLSAPAGAKEPPQKPRILSPIDLVGKKLSGENKGGTFSFLFKEDGVLEYTANGEVCGGVWSYNPNSSTVIYPFTLDWVENGKAQGYLMGFTQTGETVKIAGYWTVTGALMYYDETARFE